MVIGWERGDAWREMTTAHGIIHCSGCGREFAWHARFAGRQARCACGRVIEYPAQPDPVVSAAAAAGGEEDAYELAPIRRATHAPDEPVPVIPVEALPAQVLGYKTAKNDPGDQPDLDVDRLTKQTLPLWLLTGGVLIECGIMSLRAMFKWANPQSAALHFLIEIGFSTVVMTAGVYIAARLRQIPMGSFSTAVLRLAALIVATGAVGDVLAPAAFVVPFGWLGLMLVNFAVYFALLGTLFELDESDTWFCLAIIFILHLLLFFGVGLLWR